REIEKLKELEQIRSDLIRRISHELKTPLISIFSGSQYLLDKYKNQVNDNIQYILKNIHEGGYRLKNVVDNLLFAYSIESNEPILNFKRENLIPIIKNCVDDLIFIANKRKVFINVELVKKLYLDVDKLKISNVISNILSNAIKNTYPNGSVYIKTFEHARYVDIIIKDDGVGLTKREVPHLFKKFGKVERYGKNLNIDMEGPGLGLYISNEIVKLHNGEIVVKSKGRGKGSKFTIRLNRN
ncbi:MAG: sensor histidine kinase, partial [Promethearchaeota archaeon]